MIYPLSFFVGIKGLYIFTPAFSEIPQSHNQNRQHEPGPDRNFDDAVAQHHHKNRHGEYTYAGGPGESPEGNFCSPAA